MQVPVIDISAFLDPLADAAARAKVAREWELAFSTLGFANVVGHGVEPELIAAARQAAFAFFDLPAQVKTGCSFGGEKTSQGYLQVGSETVSKTFEKEGAAPPPDLVETLTFAFVDWERDGPLSDFERSIFRPNRWPAQPEGASATFRTYYEAVYRLGLVLMQISAAALKLPDGFFDAYYGRMATSLRLAHYPAQQERPLAGQLRYGPHTDYMGYTILLQDEQHGGLQVLGAENTWVDVQPMPGAFTVNCGDLLSRWTNTHWNSNIHRVVNPPPESAATRRLSIVMFTGPDYQAEISCLPTCATPENPARFASIPCWDHFQEKVRASLS
ncbi:MAG: 2OG-Fe(II) oxygenase [Ramlibacter sp.]|nr:2OG-Fe(II) oxygenase [Ramlibacter sp.]